MLRPPSPWASLTPHGGPPHSTGGAHSVVFRATWARGAGATLPVAVKVLRAGLLDYAIAEESLAREASTLALACDDNTNDYVVRCFGAARGVATPAWEAAIGALKPQLERRALPPPQPGAAPPPPPPELLGLVMAFVEGGSLEAKLHGGVPWQAPTAEKLRLLVGVARGVAHLHSGGGPACVVHGDLKPANILLADGNQPRLIDFGLSKVRDVVAQSARSAGSRVDGAQAGGSWPYMAPELYRRRMAAGGWYAASAPSRSTDVYAFGTLCWEVLSGLRPWAGVPEHERLEELRAGASLPWPALPLNTPPEVRALLSRMTDARKDQRPRLVDAMVELQQAAGAMDAAPRDIFISYRWKRERLPFVDDLYLRLNEEGYGAWLDRVEMGHDMREHMTRGITNAKVVLILVTPDYAAWRAEDTDNCLFELRTAARLRKPIVACMAHPGFWKGWTAQDGSRVMPEDHELAREANLVGSMFVDLGAVAALDWVAPTPPDEAVLRPLLHAETALPCLMKLLDERGVRAGARGGPVARAVAERDRLVAEAAARAEIDRCEQEKIEHQREAVKEAMRVVEAEKRRAEAEKRLLAALSERLAIDKGFRKEASLRRQVYDRKWRVDNKVSLLLWTFPASCGFLSDASVSDAFLSGLPAADFVRFFRSDSAIPFAIPIFSP
jgi:serine/threonine protein kinase